MTTGYRPELIQRSFVDFISTRIHPFWSLTVPKLRLVARYQLSNDLIALQFELNRTFRKQAYASGNGSHQGWHGGQYINLSVLIEGVYYQRSYSLVGLPHDALWWYDDNDNNSDKKINDRLNDKSKPQTILSTVTIAIKPQGLVSDYLTKHAALGAIFDSSLPNGDFTLAHTELGQQTSERLPPTSMQSPLLFIAGGSGITPMLGLTTQALQYGRKVTLLHYSRTSLLNNPLQAQWQQLATTYPTFSYHLINTEDPSTYLAGSRHLRAASLLALSSSSSTLINSTLADTQIFACGSQALLADLYRACDELSLPNGKQLRDNIRIESFGTAESFGTTASFNDTLLNMNEAGEKVANTEEQTIYLRGRQRQFNSNTTLLVGAETAGIRLKHGCRQGICQLCRCNKVSGRVRNIHTGKVSSDGYESVQTCINVAVTDVVLDI